MPEITIPSITAYLSNLYGRPVQVRSLSAQGRQEEGDDLKGFGYGTPLFLEYEVAGERKKAVLETMAPSSFGHEHFADRAQAVLWEHGAFNALPRHAVSLDSGAFLADGRMISTGTAEEFFLLTEFVPGEGYFKDLERIRETGAATAGDRQRILALADYLADIHADKTASPGLYVRRIRELIGHGECIMGLIDNYPEAFGFINQDLLKRIELRCAEWRWRIKRRTHRLCRVHGDFHPWNVLFRGDQDFTVLDRSRGEWGEPADDVSTMTINYLFFSLQQTGGFTEPWREFFETFWLRYLERTGDEEILQVTAPFFAWRGLVIASPLWYPRLPESVRRSIFRFIETVLDDDCFDFRNVERYLR